MLFTMVWDWSLHERYFTCMTVQDFSVPRASGKGRRTNRDDADANFTEGDLGNDEI